MYRRRLFPGIFFTILFGILQLATINDYGVTWDFTYHFNAGLWHLDRPLTVSPFTMFSWGPLADILPTASYLLFTETLHLFPWDAAYNLVSVAAGTLGVFVLYSIALRLFSLPVAIFSMLILATLPRYIGHLHNNMKDIPQAVLYTVSLFLFFKLYTSPTGKNLVKAFVAIAISLNMKFNGAFVLFTSFFWALSQRIHSFRQLKFTFLYFLLAPIIAFAVWMIFWEDPVFRLFDAIHSARTSTINMPLLYFGQLYFSGVNIPWHYPLGLLAATTPLPFLLFFFIGTLVLFAKSTKESNARFLLLWFFVPLLRYGLSGIVVIDDIRHFMEVLFPLSLIAGYGLAFVWSICATRLPRFQSVLVALIIGMFGYVTWQSVALHPYQTSYFSELTGGIQQAQRRFDIEFWANSYKEAARWLNTNAEENSTIITPMAPDILALYLRRDLANRMNKTNLTDADEKIYGESDYTVVMNRQSFFDWYNLTTYVSIHTPIFVIARQGVPLLFIFQNSSTKKS